MNNNIAIAFDFAGVLDVQNSFKICDSNLNERVMKQTDPVKAYKLLNLIYKYQLKFFCISTLEKYGANVVTALIRSMRNSDDENISIFAEEFRKPFARKNQLRGSSNWNTKNSSIAECIQSHNLSAVVTIEDDERIDSEYNPVMVYSRNGLDDMHLAKVEDKIIMLILGMDYISPVEKWNSEADQYNQWSELDSSERTALIDSMIKSVNSMISGVCEEEKSSNPPRLVALKALKQRLTNDRKEILSTEEVV
ncbi:hypothetical protein [Vibrio parahaemolyticus]|uniref:hypothetical protein n=1 Tax=Vibrio parahaemolyticus TaxID=670 RepID=UPI003D7C68D5